VGFTEFIYSISEFFLTPFQSIFKTSSPLPVSGSVFEWDIVVAILVYWIVALGILRLSSMGRKVSRQEAHDDLEKNS
jgi:hypothetical protein